MDKELAASSYLESGVCWFSVQIDIYIMSGLRQVPLLRPVLCNIFINDIDNEIKCAPTPCLQMTPSCVGQSIYLRDGMLSRDPERFEQWAQVIPMRFNKFTCKVLNMSCGDLNNQCKTKGLITALSKRT